MKLVAVLLMLGAVQLSTQSVNMIQRNRYCGRKLVGTILKTCGVLGNAKRHAQPGSGRGWDTYPETAHAYPERDVYPRAAHAYSDRDVFQGGAHAYSERDAEAHIRRALADLLIVDQGKFDDIAGPEWSAYDGDTLAPDEDSLPSRSESLAGHYQDYPGGNDDDNPGRANRAARYRIRAISGTSRRQVSPSGVRSLQETPIQNEVRVQRHYGPNKHFLLRSCCRDGCSLTDIMGVCD